MLLLGTYEGWLVCIDFEKPGGVVFRAEIVQSPLRSISVLSESLVGVVDNRENTTILEFNGGTCSVKTILSSGGQGELAWCGPLTKLSGVSDSETGKKKTPIVASVIVQLSADGQLSYFTCSNAKYAMLTLQESIRASEGRKQVVTGLTYPGSTTKVLALLQKEKRGIPNYYLDLIDTEMSPPRVGGRSVNFADDSSQDALNSVVKAEPASFVILSDDDTVSNTVIVLRAQELWALRCSESAFTSNKHHFKPLKVNLLLPSDNACRCYRIFSSHEHSGNCFVLTNDSIALLCKDDVDLAFGAEGTNQIRCTAVWSLKSWNLTSPLTVRSIFELPGGNVVIITNRGKVLLGSLDSSSPKITLVDLDCQISCAQILDI